MAAPNAWAACGLPVRPPVAKLLPPAAWQPRRRPCATRQRRRQRLLPPLAATAGSGGGGDEQPAGPLVSASVFLAGGTAANAAMAAAGAVLGDQAGAPVNWCLPTLSAAHLLHLTLPCLRMTPAQPLPPPRRAGRHCAAAARRAWSEPACGAGLHGAAAGGLLGGRRVCRPPRRLQPATPRVQNCAHPAAAGAALLGEGGCRGCPTAADACLRTTCIRWQAAAGAGSSGGGQQRGACQASCRAGAPMPSRRVPAPGAGPGAAGAGGGRGRRNAVPSLPPSGTLRGYCGCGARPAADSGNGGRPGCFQRGVWLPPRPHPHLLPVCNRSWRTVR